jgi:hypothetical protein
MTASKSAALLAAALLAVPPAARAAPPRLLQTAAAAPAPTAGKLRLAILDFSLAGSAHPDLARVLSDGAARGAEGSEYQIITQGEVTAVLGLDRMRQLLGCTDDGGCLSETAGALDAERLLSGSLTILERTSLVTVRLIDARKGRTLARASATLLDATEKELVDAARRLSYEVITGKRLDTSGVVRIRVDRPGAIVTLDGKEIGRSPIAGAPRVLEGPHAIVIQKDGYVRWSTTVSVAAGGEVPVDVQLVPIKLLGEAARSRLWAWGYGSAGVAALAVTSGVVFKKMADDSYAQYKRSSNRIEAGNLRDQTRQRATMATVSWAVAGASTLTATVCFVSAARADAKAAEQPSMAIVPLGNGIALSGTF